MFNQMGNSTFDLTGDDNNIIIDDIAGHLQKRNSQYRTFTHLRRLEVDDGYLELVSAGHNGAKAMLTRRFTDIQDGNNTFVRIMSPISKTSKTSTYLFVCDINQEAFTCTVGDIGHSVAVIKAMGGVITNGISPKVVYDQFGVYAMIGIHVDSNADEILKKKKCKIPNRMATFIWSHVAAYTMELYNLSLIHI